VVNTAKGSWYFLAWQASTGNTLSIIEVKWAVDNCSLFRRNQTRGRGRMTSSAARSGEVRHGAQANRRRVKAGEVVMETGTFLGAELSIGVGSRTRTRSKREGEARGKGKNSLKKNQQEGCISGPKIQLLKIHSALD